MCSVLKLKDCPVRGDHFTSGPPLPKQLLNRRNYKGGPGNAGLSCQWSYLAALVLCLPGCTTYVLMRDYAEVRARIETNSPEVAPPNATGGRTVVFVAPPPAGKME